MFWFVFGAIYAGVSVVGTGTYLFICDYLDKSKKLPRSEAEKRREQQKAAGLANSLAIAQAQA